MRVAIAAILPFLVQKLEPRLTFALGQFLKALSMTCIALFFTFHDFYPRSMYVEIFNWVPFAMIIGQYAINVYSLQTRR